MPTTPDYAALKAAMLQFSATAGTQADTVADALLAASAEELVTEVTNASDTFELLGITYMIAGRMDVPSLAAWREDSTRMRGLAAQIATVLAEMTLKIQAVRG